jgi:hypothetical protein
MRPKAKISATHTNNEGRLLSPKGKMLIKKMQAGKAGMAVQSSPHKLRDRVAV